LAQVQILQVWGTLDVFSMMKSSIIAVAIKILLASEDALLDDGISLLQLRVENVVHKSLQAPVPGVVKGPLNTACKPGEALTFEQCISAKQNDIPNRSGPEIYPEIHLSGPRGCFFHGFGNNAVYYNVDPIDMPHSQFNPICSPEGGRDFQQEGCVRDTDQSSCLNGDETHSMTLPPAGVETLPGGSAQCGECGVLNLDQCFLATGVVENPCIDTGLGSRCIPYFSERPGGKSNGPEFAKIEGPVGCFRGSPDGTDGRQRIGIYYNPGPTGGPLDNAEPICGVCPTTTTPAPTTPAPTTPAPISPPGVDDEASAVGDPHMNTAYEKEFDLEQSSFKT